MQEQEQFNEIRGVKCNGIYKLFGKLGLAEYSKRKGRGESQKHY